MALEEEINRIGGVCRVGPVPAKGHLDRRPILFARAGAKRNHLASRNAIFQVVCEIFLVVLSQLGSQCFQGLLNRVGSGLLGVASKFSRLSTRIQVCFELLLNRVRTLAKLRRFVGRRP